MPWLQLIIPSDLHHAEKIADAMMDVGAASATLQDMQDQPVLEPAPGTTPLWSQTRVIGLFEADVNLQQRVAQIQNIIGETLTEWKAEQLEDKDWIRAWMDNFKPMRFGQHLWVVPGTYDPPEPDAVNLVLDPGLAFGTGTHPTTSMCLEWLDAHPPRKPQIIDYGCGSGILAIAALLFGANHVLAVDNDPQALLATKDNAKKNDVEDRVSTALPGDVDTQQQCDLLLANILAAPLISLEPLFAQLTRAGGAIVLSGILASQAEEVLSAYRKDFDIRLWKQLEGWVCLSGTRCA